MFAKTVVVTFYVVEFLTLNAAGLAGLFVASGYIQRQHIGYRMLGYVFYAMVGIVALGRPIFYLVPHAM